jgi:exonuclease SbcD
MRVAIIADSHFDEHSRFEECQRIHRWIARDLESRGVDLILHSGDIFERKSTPAERNAVADWIESLAALAPVVVVRGNHDQLGDLAIFGELKTKHPVIVEEGAGVYILQAGKYADDPSHRAAVACLAWPRKASLLALTGETGKEASEQTAREALQNVLRGLGQRLAAHDGPRILLTHAMVRGSKTSLGQPLVGCDMEIGLEDLALCAADVYALGHIHMPQDWSINGAPVIYPGSPRRTAFGEVEVKGYVLAEFRYEADAHDHVVSWQRIATPATPMVLIEAEWTAEGFRGGEYLAHHLASDPRGCEIRFRYAVDADARDAARAAAATIEEDFLGQGAVSVKIEERVRPKSVARAPEIVQAQDIGEKLHALWNARNATPEPARAERLVSMATSLEGESRHAA